MSAHNCRAGLPRTGWFFRQRTPAHIDPVVAFIHRGGWSQVKYRIGNGLHPKYPEALAIPPHQAQAAPASRCSIAGQRLGCCQCCAGGGCGVVRDVRNHRVSRSEREARAVVGRDRCRPRTPISQ